jgi:vanillate O-demethylase monooxygenase subunit
MKYIYDAWYPAGHSREFNRTLLARQVCDERLVFYRTLEGTPVALRDSCCHRQMPLSRGRLDGDQLVCAYHGLRYAPSGKCVHMPTHSTPYPGAGVKAYRLQERHNLVWLWVGDEAAADPALIPSEFSVNDDPGWAADGSAATVKHVRCDYRLLIDNLLDLTHETFLHTSTIGDDEILRTPMRVVENGDRVTVDRLMADIECPPWYARMLRMARGYTGPVDRWQKTTFVPPCMVALDVGVAPAGTPPEERAQRGITIIGMDFLIPSGDRQTTYLWSLARDFLLDDHRLTAEITSAMQHVFGEDTVAVEAQQLNMDAHPGQRMINLNVDRASLLYRKIIDTQAVPVAAK